MWGKRETAFRIDRSKRWEVVKIRLFIGLFRLSSSLLFLLLPLLLLHSTDGECISVSYRTANRRIRRNRSALWPCSTLLYTAWIKLNQSVLPRNEGRSANPLSIRFAIVRRTERTFSLFFLHPSFFFLFPLLFLFVGVGLVINLIFHRVITGRLMAATSYFFVRVNFFFFFPSPFFDCFFFFLQTFLFLSSLFYYCSIN